MTNQDVSHPWRTWIGWLLANTAGCLLGFGLLDVVVRQMGWLAPSTSPDVNIVMSAAVYTLGAGLLALCQWLLLGMRVSGWAAWAAVTMLGFLVGDLGSRAIEGLLSGRVPLGELTSFISFCALIGVGVGSGQWLLLRRSFPHAGWWIVANAAGWTGGALAFIATQAIVRSDLSLLAFAAILGAVLGMITWLCLVWLWQMPGAREPEYAVNGL